MWNPFHFLARNQSDCILWFSERLFESWHKQKDLAVFLTLGTFVFSKLEHHHTKCRRCANRHTGMEPDRAQSHKSPPNTCTSGPRWQAAWRQRPSCGKLRRLVAPTKVPTFVLELVYQLPKPRTDCDGDVQKGLLKLKTELFTNIAAKFQKLYVYMLHIMKLTYRLSKLYLLYSTGWCSTLTLLLICSSFSRENDHPLLMNAHQDQCKFYILHPSPPFFPSSSLNFQKRLGKETPHLQTILQLKHSISAWIAGRPTHLWGGSQDLDLSVVNNHGLVVSKSPKDRVVGPPSKWPIWYINSDANPNHLQVMAWSSKYQMDPEPIVIHGVLGPRKKMAENKWL